MSIFDTASEAILPILFCNPFQPIDISIYSGDPFLSTCRKSVYMAMTIPGVQKPHCDPCSSAMRFCTTPHDRLA